MEIKEKIVRESLDRVILGYWNAEYYNGEIYRSLFIFSEASCVIVKDITGFLINKPLGEIIGSKLEDKLWEIVKVKDKAGLLELITELEEASERILERIIESDFRIDAIYRTKYGFTIPCFVKDYESMDATSHKEFASQFIPVANEWTDRKEGYKVGYNDKHMIYVEGLLEVEKLFSEKDFDRLLEKRINKYNELKAKYPQEAEIVERLYPVEIDK